VTLGGDQGNNASIGKVIGPSFFAEDMPDVISKVIDVFVEKREPEEKFIDAVRRLGITPFKERVYQDRPNRKAADEVSHG
jgi:sulfite reductase (NADPH) hemoprotein beta-component